MDCHDGGSGVDGHVTSTQWVSATVLRRRRNVFRFLSFVQIDGKTWFNCGRFISLNTMNNERGHRCEILLFFWGNCVFERQCAVGPRALWELGFLCVFSCLLCISVAHPLPALLILWINTKAAQSSDRQRTHLSILLSCEFLRIKSSTHKGNYLSSEPVPDSGCLQLLPWTDRVPGRGESPLLPLKLESCFHSIIQISLLLSYLWALEVAADWQLCWARFHFRNLLGFLKWKRLGAIL